MLMFLILLLILFLLKEMKYHLYLKKEGQLYVEDVLVPFPRLQEFFSFLQGRECYGHIGIDVYHIHYGRDDDRSALYAFIQNIGGQCGAQFGYGMIKAKYTPIAIRNRIKRLLSIHNPHNYLNPARTIREHVGDENEKK